MSAFSTCTVITRDRFAYARVLARSIAAHHPGITLTVVVVDPVEGEDTSHEPFRVLTPRDVGIDNGELFRRRTMYTPIELTGSIRPVALTALLESTGAPALYLDCDVRVYGSLEDHVNEAQRAGLVLSPHENEWTTDAPTASEWMYLRASAFNAGFLAVAPTLDGPSFLAWWAGRTRRHCLSAPEQSMFVEQRWLDLVPSLFRTAVCRHPGTNLMAWRLAHRDVDADTMTFRGAPILSVHFCGGFDPDQPDRIGTMPGLPWPDAAHRPGFAALCRSYADELLEAGHHDEMARGYAYRTMPDGRVLDPLMRRAYRSALLESEAAGSATPPNPFEHGTAAFMELLRAPMPGSGLSRYHHQLWSDRLDLRIAFPTAGDGDPTGLLGWLAHYPEHAV